MKLVCPECENDRVVVYTETAYDVNTMDHYCHTIKPHDSDANVSCLDCKWEGKRRNLKEKNHG